MYSYSWDEETGGLLLNSSTLQFSKEPRPVYYKELDILGFDKYWNYDKDDSAPLMWAEANNYIYRGKHVATVKGGSLESIPTIQIIEAPEPDDSLLKKVDITAMVKKNKPIIDALTKSTIKQIYNSFEKYNKKGVDVFYVAFSGGKDSIVTLDLVQKALPHNSFKVLFGDTGMEFPDTYRTVEVIERKCRASNIDFIRSKSPYSPDYTWSMFGPPATVNRWCCSVHKTTPQILSLRNVTGIHNFTGMAFVGVRASESIARSGYDYISLGEKHKGQYSCNPILEWNSAELYVYIFSEGLYINEAYKKGNRRAGCLVCPRAAERSEYFAHRCYKEEFEKLICAIKKSYEGHFSSSQNLDQFIVNGGWKARKNGRDLCFDTNYEEYETNGEIIIKIKRPRTSWKEWIKTIGVLQNIESPYTIEIHNQTFEFSIEEDDGLKVILDSTLSKTSPNFVKSMKNVFHKVSSCVQCKVCEADCHNGSIHMESGIFYIDNTCKHCSMCHKVEKGCLVYKSLEKPKALSVMNSKKTMSLNCYSHHAPKMDWFIQFFKYKEEFESRHSLGKNMYDFFKRFLKDADLMSQNVISKTAIAIENIGLENSASWGLMFANLVYTPQFNWLVKNITFNEISSKDYILSQLLDSGAKESWVNDIWSSFTRISALPFSEVGFGIMTIENKKAVSLTRIPWVMPNQVVILYSLYKYAEACGGYYQFSMSQLYNKNIDSDGVSPYMLFGIEEEDLKKILIGLSSNYESFINVSFTHNLDNINLREDKSAEDVLELFN